MDNLSSKGMVGRTYIGKHDALLHTSVLNYMYSICGSRYFIEAFCKVFPHFKFMEANYPRKVFNLDPRDIGKCSPWVSVVSYSTR